MSDGVLGIGFSIESGSYGKSISQTPSPLLPRSLWGAIYLYAGTMGHLLFSWRNLFLFANLCAVFIILPLFLFKNANAFLGFLPLFLTMGVVLTSVSHLPLFSPLLLPVSRRGRTGITLAVALACTGLTCLLVLLPLALLQTLLTLAGPLLAQHLPNSGSLQFASAALPWLTVPYSLLLALLFFPRSEEAAVPGAMLAFPFLFALMPIPFAWCAPVLKSLPAIALAGWILLIFALLRHGRSRNLVRQERQLAALREWPGM